MISASEGGTAGASDLAGGSGEAAELGGAAGMAGSDPGSAADAGAAGSVEQEPPKPAVASCRPPEDASRWANGKKLYVGVQTNCGGLQPCFGSIYSATISDQINDGDTIVVLPGVHGNDIAQLSGKLKNLRITGVDPATTSIEGGHLLLTRADSAALSGGEVWIDHLTFRNSGPVTSSVDDGWGLYASSFTNPNLRVLDNVFVGHKGRGAMHLYVDNLSVARNVFLNNTAPGGALNVGGSEDSGREYCVRIENNLVYLNTVGLQLLVPAQNTPRGVIEVVNNTFAKNQLGLQLARTGVTELTNNIVFGNDQDLETFAEIGFAAIFRNNLIGSGQFTGLRGNFSADPLFVAPNSGDFHLRPGSPALGRGAVLPAPTHDIGGVARGYYPDLGAYERLQETGEHLSGLSCGDGVTQWGDVTTASGTFRGFETCDDGNRIPGDGCSEFCQHEPFATPGHISRLGDNLCAIGTNKSLSCWGEIAKGAPTGSFAQVSLAMYYACALRSDGSVVCWLPNGLLGAFQPAGKYSSISGDYSQICGVRSDGGIACWNDSAATFAKDGNFVRAATNNRVCGLSAAGASTCWDPYPDFPTGPFLQVFPDRYGGCGSRLNGALTCLSGESFFVASPPDAALFSVSLSATSGVGLRPDGRAISWQGNGITTPSQNQAYIEVSFGCGLTVEHDVHCWNTSAAFPK